jgi:5-carboxymethyl-2-hydroxymuconate isomerase
MPHIIVEYNSAIERAANISDLTDKLHSCAVAHDALPIGGIRTRAYAADNAKVGDGAPENGFIYITLRLGEGRSAEVKKDIGDQLFGVLESFTQQIFTADIPLSLGLEIQDIEKEWTWKKNNIHRIIKDKKNGQ